MKTSWQLRRRGRGGRKYRLWSILAAEQETMGLDMNGFIDLITSKTDC